MKRLTNAAMLREWLERSACERLRPVIKTKKGGAPIRWAKPGDLKETSQAQGMAQLFAEQLLALSRGAAECRAHQGHVDGACPVCDGRWPQATNGRQSAAKG